MALSQVERGILDRLALARQALSTVSIFSHLSGGAVATAA